MSALVPIVMWGWIPLVLLMFCAMAPRRALIVAFLFAWLFLPMAEYKFSGFPNYSKMSATSLGVLAGVLLFDAKRISNFRFLPIDLFIVFFCLTTLFSSLSNGLGIYDGISAFANRLIEWGIPYFVGRLYFSDMEGLRDLVVGVFIGGLVYVPLCLYEIRLSPQLHNLVYGYHQHMFAQTVRGGGFGWRPMVFMQHGLMVGMWMVAASLCGFWIWLTGIKKTLYGMPIGPMVLVLGGTAVLCKSTGALVLFLVGLGALTTIKYFKTSMPLLILFLIPCVYIVVRATGLWDGQALVQYSETLFGQERAGSLEYRIDNEEILSEHARLQPVFGWGGWGRSRPEGVATITDSLWIIVFGQNGYVALAAWLCVLVIPAVSLSRKISPRLWTHPAVSPAVIGAMILALWMIDNCVNDMMNPVFVLFAGGLAGLKRVRVQRQVRAPAFSSQAYA